MVMVEEEGGFDELTLKCGVAVPPLPGLQLTPTTGNGRKYATDSINNPFTFLSSLRCNSNLLIHFDFSSDVYPSSALFLNFNSHTL